MQLDKSEKHLTNVEKELEELQQGYNWRVCHTIKNQKYREKNINEKITTKYAKNSKHHHRRQQKKSTSDETIDKNILLSDQYSRDMNFKRMQELNFLIDNEIQDQIKTLNCLHANVDLNTQKLIDTNFRVRRTL
ncbi:unnamed protein product [Didymodactylos carnosus]|uniref:Uncharacterized protein n=1 Tax=Didymodactylos carnosus TaxID=1234261 RepID=A0A813UKX9_9BILA|nr:unnamed protein product [Didymodactylos carnosus]CAF0832027.1 unnamed protein product [Didymodactylos carnosus]CAF3616570.1 unnamed protein product [Didymodactylos carnosus]CAF3617671.1 unnamed protein product [Didymodactylos carnosus]